MADDVDLHLRLWTIYRLLGGVDVAVDTRISRSKYGVGRVPWTVYRCGHETGRRMVGGQSEQRFQNYVIFARFDVGVDCCSFGRLASAQFRNVFRGVFDVVPDDGLCKRGVIPHDTVHFQQSVSLVACDGIHCGNRGVRSIFDTESFRLVVLELSDGDAGILRADNVHCDNNRHHVVFLRTSEFGHQVLKI